VDRGRLFVQLEDRFWQDISLVCFLQETIRTQTHGGVVALTLGCCNNEGLRLCFGGSSSKAAVGANVVNQASSISP